MFKDAFVLIEVIAGRNDINPYKQISILNEVFNEYEPENYGFNPFALTEIIFTRDCCSSTFFLSLADCKGKMKSIRFGKDIYSYMSNIIDENKARELGSVSVARFYCFLLTEAVFHENVGQPPCFCFRCHLKNLVREILVERDKQRMLLVVTINNFYDFSNNQVFSKLLSS